jgi:hypothetical protein
MTTKTKANSKVTQQFAVPLVPVIKWTYSNTQAAGRGCL